jgi:hypothetical protein
VPFPLATSFALLWYTSGLTIKDEVSALESMEFRRPRLYTEAFGNDTPTLSFAGLVYLYNFFVWVSGHLAKLEAHEGVSRYGDRFDDDLDLRQGDTELGAQFDREAMHVGPGLDIKVVKETIESSSGYRRAAKENERYHRENDFLHGNPSLFKDFAVVRSIRNISSRVKNQRLGQFVPAPHGLIDDPHKSGRWA